jgi:hypothetical protein
MSNVIRLPARRPARHPRSVIAHQSIYDGFAVAAHALLIERGRKPE